MKKVLGTIIAIVIIGGIAMLLVSNKKKMASDTATGANETEVVSTLTIEQQEYTKEFTSNAAVQAAKELNFVSDIQGRVTNIYVDKGSKVAKGAPLLKIDNELIESDYLAAKAAYEAMDKDVERFTKSHKAGGVSDQQLDGLKTQLMASYSRYKAAKWRYENSVVKAPISGTINMRYVEEGSLIAPNAPLFEIVDDSRLKLTAMVPENKLCLIEKGQKITATEGGNTYTGTVTSIGVKTDRGMNYPVEIALEKNSGLHVGMYLKVTFRQEGICGILIPRKAVVGSAIAANVYLAQDGIAVKREVKLGDMYGNNIEITEGLEPGETIIVEGLMNIADGSQIKTK